MVTAVLLIIAKKPVSNREQSQLDSEMLSWSHSFTCSTNVFLKTCYYAKHGPRHLKSSVNKDSYLLVTTCSKQETNSKHNRHVNYRARQEMSTLEKKKSREREPRGYMYGRKQLRTAERRKCMCSKWKNNCVLTKSQKTVSGLFCSSCFLM